MSCAYKAGLSSAVGQVSTHVAMDRRPVLRAILATFDAFREALEMRRAAQKRCFLGDE
jgi:hypothetical protein